MCTCVVMEHSPVQCVYTVHVHVCVSVHSLCLLLPTILTCQVRHSTLVVVWCFAPVCLLQYWQGPFLPSHDRVPWPVPRSFHSAVSLSDPEQVPRGGAAKVLVLWGMNQETVPLGDVWTLDVRAMVWEKVGKQHKSPQSYCFLHGKNTD